MGRNVDVKLKLRGLNKLMSSQPVRDEVTKRAHRIRAAAGDGYEVKEHPHPWTARAYVRAKDQETARRDAKHQTLLRAIDAGRS